MTKQRPSVPFFLSFFSDLCIQTRAMGRGDMGHVFNTRCLCCCKIRQERGKQNANPVAREQITDKKTDMIVAGLAKKKQQKKREHDDRLIECEHQRKVTVRNKQVQEPHV